MTKVRFKYDDIIFDSSWELAFYIYLKDYGIPFEYHPNVEIPYKIEEDDEKFHLYHPDFKVHGKYIEIKNNWLLEHYDRYKLEFLDTFGIELYTDKDIKPFLDYVENKYGKYYMYQFVYQKPKQTN